MQVPAVLYAGIWLVDMVIAFAHVAETLGANIEFEWEPFYQVARYAAIFLVPPYSLVACGAAIEGVRLFARRSSPLLAAALTSDSSVALLLFNRTSHRFCDV